MIRLAILFIPGRIKNLLERQLKDNKLARQNVIISRDGKKDPCIDMFKLKRGSMVKQITLIAFIVKTDIAVMIPKAID